MNPENPFDRSRNLEDPAQLAAEMRDLQAAMKQESDAAKSNGAGRGHSDPGYLYGRVALVLEKGASLIDLAVATKPDTPKEPDKPTPTPAPASDPKKK